MKLSRNEVHEIFVGLDIWESMLRAYRLELKAEGKDVAEQEGRIQDVRNIKRRFAGLQGRSAAEEFNVVPRGGK